MGCPVHKGKGYCSRPREVRLRRSDFAGAPPVEMCRACADDALESGVFDENAGRRRKLSSRGRVSRKRNPGSNAVVRIGRTEEVRYMREIGRKPGPYSHKSGRNSRGKIYTVPPGWYYVSKKAVIIAEERPRRR